MSSEALQTDQNPILACTICRDVQNFELLIVDMEEALGEQWGDLGFEDAVPFMAQPEAEHLEFIAIAMDDMDEDSLDELTDIITEARNRNIRTLLIAEDVTPASLHTLLRHGADEFIPYPLPPGELQAAIEKIRAAAKAAEHRVLALPGDLAHRLEVAFRGDRETGLDDVDAHLVQKLRDLQLLGMGHRRPGGLFAIPQGGVKDQHAVLFRHICHPGFFLCCHPWRAAHPSERARRRARSEAD